MQKIDSFLNKFDAPKYTKQQFQIPLPVIQQKKSKNDNDPKFINSHPKKQSLAKYGQQIKQAYLQKIYKDQQLFMKDPSVLLILNQQKNKHYKKTPIKLKIKQKLYQTLEEQKIKKLMKKQEQIINPFTEQKYEYIDPNQRANNFKINVEKASSRAKIYQPYRKISSNPGKNQLKPITSETKINNDNYFFNVEKMTLLNNEKKSKSTCVASIYEQKRILRQMQRINPNSKLIKEIVKQKGYKKIMSLNNDTQDNQSNNKLDSIDNLPVQLQGGQKNGEQSSITERLKENKEDEKRNSAQVETLSSKINKNKMKINLNMKRYKKFNLPFQTYYYRDLIWKVNYTNRLFVEVPQEYEHRLKVFVGKGNNSCMVAGLIARRPYFAITDKYEEANFAWTQLKLLNYYKKQQPFPKDSAQTNANIDKSSPQYLQTSLMLPVDKKKFEFFFNNNFTSEQHADERWIARSKYFKYNRVIKMDQIKNTRMHNHLINNYVIGNKKALFNTMSNYYKSINQDVFQYLPLTFHIKDGLQDKTYFQFLKYYHKRNKEVTKYNQQKEKGAVKEYNAWIVKPGQNSNRGNGIKMCLKLQEIKQVLKKREVYNDGTYRTYIVQSYIQKPLLYQKRKFDLRHYIMMTSINGYIKGYWYKDGYVRTTSSEYNLKSNEGGTHLTNDAVQKFLPDYGKYQKGNKISYEQLHNYIEKYYKKKQTSFYDKIYPKMKKIATDAMKACSGGIDPNKFQNNFQVFGMDFMIDQNLDVWLIEINTNPCLQLSCPLLASIIPKMVQNALQLTLDAMFPPPVRYSPKGMHYYKELQKQNKFQLVFDQRIEDLCDLSLSNLDNKLLQEQDDVFEDCGQELDWTQS